MVQEVAPYQSQRHIWGQWTGVLGGSVSRVGLPHGFVPAGAGEPVASAAPLWGAGTPG